MKERKKAGAMGRGDGQLLGQGSAADSALRLGPVKEEEKAEGSAAELAAESGAKSARG